ncbi:MAG: phosphate transport system permease protein [Solirubrobacteraceae bacterium]|jgi:phosphate transport system permease protein|nr:phosphate transport system permease protein [Solirubrobacteraceae bacterium]
MSAAPLSLRPKSGAARVKDIAFRVAMLICLLFSGAVLVALLVDVLIDALPVLGSRVFTSFPSSNSSTAGLQPAIWGTLWIIGVCLVFIVPVGVATAVYLEEYADGSKWWNRLIEVNIQNLAAVPSIVYGILGLAFLVRGPLSLGRVVLAGGLTLGLLVLPVVIISGREAIRAVPPSIREGSMALGATQWQTIYKQVLPASIPGVATGVILALSRAIGETAPLIVVGAFTFITFDPHGIVGEGAGFSALPIQIFSWISQPQTEFHQLAAAGIVLLLGLLLCMNGVAIYLRNRYENKW